MTDGQGSKVSKSLVQSDPETGEVIVRDVVSSDPCGNFTRTLDPPEPLPDDQREHWLQVIADPEGHGFTPDSVDYIRTLVDVGYTSTGDNFWCTHHIAEAFDVPEYEVAAFGLIRSDLVHVESIDELMAAGHEITRMACDADWFGKCIWAIGEVIHFIPAPDAMKLLLQGDFVVEDVPAEKQYTRHTA